jgi:hypothetical protein
MHELCPCGCLIYSHGFGEIKLASIRLETYFSKNENSRHKIHREGHEFYSRRISLSAFFPAARPE